MDYQDQSVYSFELHFLEALRRVLTFKDAQTLVFGDADTKAQPRIEIGFTSGLGNETDRVLLNNGTQQYLRSYSGVATVQVFSVLGDQATHFYLVGSCRSRLGYRYPELIAPTLPLYQVKGVYEQPSQNGISNTEDSEITTVLSFRIDFVIPPSAFADREGYLTFNGKRLVFNGVPLTYNFEPIQNT